MPDLPDPAREILPYADLLSLVRSLEKQVSIDQDVIREKNAEIEKLKAAMSPAESQPYEPHAGGGNLDG